VVADGAVVAVLARVVELDGLAFVVAGASSSSSSSCSRPGAVVAGAIVAVVAFVVEGPEVDGPAVEGVGAAVVEIVTFGGSSLPRRPESEPLPEPPLSAEAGMAISAMAAKVAAERRRVFAAEFPAGCFIDESVERCAFENIRRPVLSLWPIVGRCVAISVQSHWSMPQYDQGLFPAPFRFL
jgi:hypothetical protein